MPAASAKTPPPIHLTRRGWLVVAVLVIVSLATIGYAFRPQGTNDPVPSFDDPIGRLDASKVPNGWAPAIEAAARTAGIPAPVLAAQLDAESKWDPNARSDAGAQGLAQFTPEAWASHGKGDPFNPLDAIAAQGRLMRDMKRRADASGIDDNSVKLALAGYNAGFGNVTKYRGVPPFPETQNYLDRIARRMGYYALPTPTRGVSSASGSTPPTR